MSGFQFVDLATGRGGKKKKLMFEGFVSGGVPSAFVTAEETAASLSVSKTSKTMNPALVRAGLLPLADPPMTWSTLVKKTPPLMQLRPHKKHQLVVNGFTCSSC